MSTNIYLSVFDAVPTWVMLAPIFLCSIVGVAIIIERVVFFRRISHDYRLVVAGCLEGVRAGKTQEARALVARYPGPISEVIDGFLSSLPGNGAGPRIIADLSSGAIRKIERHLGTLSTIATITPMFGLLGTVTGMMKSFSGLTREGQFAHDLLARGIAEALITTALGLIVAIPAWIFYNYMVSRVDGFVKDLEHVANALADHGEQ
ncbi:MAG TPA: MotA/TolQ/ExbB proton channel family protein [Spirochaetota bacterium]|nr:MotA/TolQ/ExbB proton channel family protein [Spirochaetota bacterium]